MKITNAAGDSFELKILGFEFHEPDNPSDSNWLLIEIRVKLGESTWSSVHPGLTTDEVDQLATWLKNIRQKFYSDPVCSFIEPNLEFQIVEYEAGEKILRVFFELDFHPEPGSSDLDGIEDLWMDFELDNLDSAALGNELRFELKNLPPRTPPSSAPASEPPSSAPAS